MAKSRTILARTCVILIVAVQVSLSGNSGAHAQDTADPPDKQAAALRLLNATHFMDRHQQAENAVAGNAMLVFLEACTKSPPAYPWQEKQCNDRVKTWRQVAEILAAHRAQRLGTLQSLAIHLYATTYTTDELNQASDFFESPVGRKLEADDAGLGKQVSEKAQLELSSALTRAEQSVIGVDVRTGK